MPTILVNSPFPPRTQQLVTGAGTLQSVKAHGPSIFVEKGSLPADPMRFDSSLPRYANVLNADFYDGVSLASATRIFSIGSSDSGPINAAFSQGLICVQRDGNTMDVVYTTN